MPVTKAGLTPSSLPVRARNLQVCRWPLEYGIEVDDRCTKESLAALHGAVAKDGAEMALLFIADHDADIDVRTSTRKSIQTLM
jgi:hypothetical protein